ncbi:prolyl aminopeptidase [Colwellia psychrerythraea]|uniref:Proline iminopeptidase n=1 Tax=Colwellia psychrerythraea (strain 34H / ATCC BAA-681) TaxID=167879 RepID=Q488A3_COLP3|nr:prolyl aminopeptidase [Colwellia psychrerythraea]AAZ24400.1 proline iminopeptidase [Colwellia psychrerythraea 34H]
MLHSLYPEIEPFSQQYLKVSPLHQLYIEQCGNEQGIPVIFLHGGPGSACREQHRCYFDPAIYHIILFDQRGCGRSKPQGELKENNTLALVEDINTIRKHLGISQWLVFGGSWGATLALVYAKQYPKQVLGMILRGVFLGRAQDINWVYTNKGAAQIYPDAWQALVDNLPIEQQQAPLNALYQRLINSDEQISRDAYNRLQQWESAILNIQPGTPASIVDTINKKPSIIQLHYSINRCFIEKNPILEQITQISDIPIKIIQGRYDFVCPVEQAWQLAYHCPQAKLTVIDMAGHLANEPLMSNALVEATLSFSKQFLNHH